MASRWTDEETRLLISIWGESKIQEELEGAVRNKSVYQKITKKLSESGYNRDWNKCREKIKNLKTEFKKVKDHNNHTGEDRKVCHFYNEINEIIGTKAAIDPPCLLESGNSSIFDEEREEIDPLSTTDYENTEELHVDTEQLDSNVQDDDIDTSLTSEVTNISTSSLTMESSSDADLVEQSTSKRKKAQAGQNQPNKKVKKVSTIQKATKEVMELFVKYQQESEEKRRQEEREHEERMMRLLFSIVQPPQQQPFYYSQLHSPQVPYPTQNGPPIHEVQIINLILLTKQKF